VNTRITGADGTAVTISASSKLNALMPSEHFLFLALADRHLTGNVVRCLNSAGRWAMHGVVSAPLLVWRTDQATAAQAAAERAATARNQQVEVVSRESSTWTEGREIQIFTDAVESVLMWPAAQSSAKARRLRTEADKLEAFCMVVRAASTATGHHEFGDVARAASKALRTKFGGGSITSAFSWLSERAGQEALESVLAGEIELTGPLSLQQVIEAVALAQQAELLREKS